MADTITIVQTGEVREIEFTEGATVKQVIADELGLTPEDLQADGLQIRLNNVATSDLDAALKAGDQLLLVGNIAGA